MHISTLFYLGRSSLPIVFLYVIIQAPGCVYLFIYLFMGALAQFWRKYVGGEHNASNWTALASTHYSSLKIKNRIIWMRGFECDLWITSRDIIVAYHSDDCESEDYVGNHARDTLPIEWGKTLNLKVADAAINIATFTDFNTWKERVRLPRCLLPINNWSQDLKGETGLNTHYILKPLSHLPWRKCLK